MVELEKAKIATSANRASHLLLRAELDGIICSGASRDKKQTYALLEKRVLKTKPLTRDEALATLAGKYFTSHCPATLQDFAWWSGLSVSDAKNALELVKSGFVSETIDSQTYWFTNSFSIPGTAKETFYLLPAYDEFIISYKDRSASLSFENHKKAVSNNGMFWPVIVINGKVTGTWKRSIKKDNVIMETKFFKQPDKAEKSMVEEASEKFGRFLNRNILVS